MHAFGRNINSAGLIAMKKILNKIIFFIGWLLSPLTFWNDAFVNIPIAYLLATLTIRFIKADFSALVLVFYWLTNIIGIVVMVISGKAIIKDRKEALREILMLLVTIVSYSLVILLLVKTGLIKPF